MPTHKNTKNLSEIGKFFTKNDASSAMFNANYREFNINCSCINFDYELHEFEGTMKTTGNNVFH